MKAAPLLIAWHNDSSPIYSAHFEPKGKARLATAGGDHNVRLWKLEQNGDDRKVEYLATLKRHTAAVNVVRWHPNGEVLASAGDDGNVLLWQRSDQPNRGNLDEETVDDKETWIVKSMCRTNAQSRYDIYDLAWSPDGKYFVTGSMDNVARIFDAQTGMIVSQVAEHNHYVQGVAWDPLNEYIATQSSDRSIHVYTLRTNDGQFALSQHSRMSRMDLPGRRRRTSNSPAPVDRTRGRARVSSDASLQAGPSPAPSCPGTPASHSLPMPPPSTHSRRSSMGGAGAASPSIRRSASPAPSMPLPAVMPPASPDPHLGLGIRNSYIYANETLTSFFRRLTFAPDGSLLFTPAGQYKIQHLPGKDSTSKSNGDDVINTVYIYARAGLNKPPVAHLPGHKKPSIAVRCSPILYNLRLPTATKNITVDTSASAEDMTPLPDPVVSAKSSTPQPHPGEMQPPPRSVAQSPPAESDEKAKDPDPDSTPTGPPPAFSLPYRVVYAVATQDAVYVYDTQQQSPICVVSNLHYATFTDVAWSTDGGTLLMSSSDGFCSALSFAANELGSVYHGSLASRVNRSQQPTAINTTGSNHSTPVPTPTGLPIPSPTKAPTSVGVMPSPSPLSIPQPPASSVRPVSPTRSNSASSVATNTSFPPTPAKSATAANSANTIISNPTPSFGHVPSIVGSSSGNGLVGGASSVLTSPTPPMTPLGRETGSARGSFSAQHHAPSVLGKRSSSDLSKPGPVLGSVAEEAVAVSETDEEGGATRQIKKVRRVQPTLVERPEGSSGQG